MGSFGRQSIAALVLLNLALQIFDAVATYWGLGTGFGEGNPLLAGAIGRWGVLPALLMFKLEACGCLLAIWTLRRSRLAGPALMFSATTYAACSVAPWAAALSFHLASYIAS